MKILVTGSSGRIGSELCAFFTQKPGRFTGLITTSGRPFLVSVVILVGISLDCRKLWAKALFIMKRIYEIGYQYSGEARIDDHICYYSGLRKMRDHYPNWDISVSLEETIKQIVEAANQ